MQNIAVFCASSNLINPLYFNEASKLGEWLGKNQKRLIYGGSKQGLMEAVAKGAKLNNGQITGVITEDLKKRDLQSRLPDEWIEADVLCDRKQKIIEYADLFIALPGGLGTLDEIFEVLAGIQMGYHEKPLIICNINNFYSSVLQQINLFVSENFASEKSLRYFYIVNSIDECIHCVTELEKTK